MIMRYPNPLSFRLNSEAIIPKEYLSMTKYLVFEVGFSEKPYSRVRQRRQFDTAENEATTGKPYCNSRGDVTGSDFDLM